MSLTDLTLQQVFYFLVVGQQEDLLDIVNRVSRLRSCWERIVIAGKEERRIMGETRPTTQKSTVELSFTTISGDICIPSNFNEGIV